MGWVIRRLRWRYITTIYLASGMCLHFAFVYLNLSVLVCTFLYLDVPSPDPVALLVLVLVLALVLVRFPFETCISAVQVVMLRALQQPRG